MEQPTQLVSSDLNGTLVHRHTMSDMINIYLGPEKFALAEPVFKRQTSGLATMEEAFGNAGPLTRGLTLRQGITYTIEHMKYVDGFHESLDGFHKDNIPFIINSTGYSITIHAIRAQVGRDKIHGQIGNNLVFGHFADKRQEVRDDELEELIFDYFTRPDQQQDKIYDEIRATGEVRLGIENEDAKAELLVVYAAKHFPHIPKAKLRHTGDTMGDSGGIAGVARMGGRGYAFNYNEPLKDFLVRTIAAEPELADRLYLVDPKGPKSNFMNVSRHIRR